MENHAIVYLLFVAVLQLSVRQSFAQTSDKIKLVGGSVGSEGTVYVQDAGSGEWGLVCDDGWSFRSGRIVCQQLGYSGIKQVTKFNHFSASPTDKIFLDDVQCVGNEKVLIDCPHRAWKTHNCESKEAAGVICLDGASDSSAGRLPAIQPVRTRQPRYRPSALAEYLRRTGGIAPPQAQPAPQPAARTTTARPVPAPAPRTIRTTTTTTTTTTPAPRTNPPQTNPPRTNPRPATRAATTTTTTTTTTTPVPPRTTTRKPVSNAVLRTVSLSNGLRNNDNEGYVQATLSDGSVGSICSDSWSLKEATVVCRELNKDFASRATASDFFYGAGATKVVHKVVCQGQERKLADCSVTVTTAEQCGRSQNVAGVICTDKLPDLIPNITELERTLSIQDLPMAYLECSMEEDCLASTAYTLKEQYPSSYTQLSRRLLRFSSSVYNQGTADFRPVQHRSTWEWHSCHAHYHSMDVFTHYDITDQAGQKVAEGHKASFCLEDVYCEGKPKKYQCRGGGDQGISVGCADIYAHTIDCQWIDISDLKAGNYLFKLKVNPDELIPEISFDNNVISCTFEYTGYSVSLSNCSHGRR